MSIILPALGVGFAAFCIWLTVRIVNRRERWAKWTLAAVIAGLPVLYVLSFGPACWLIAADGTKPAALPILYLPIGWAITRWEMISDAACSYASFGMRPDTRVMVPIDDGIYLPILQDTLKSPSQTFPPPSADSLKL